MVTTAQLAGESKDLKVIKIVEEGKQTELQVQKIDLSEKTNTALLVLEMDGVVSDLLDLPEKLSKPVDFFSNDDHQKKLEQRFHEGMYQMAWRHFRGVEKFEDQSFLSVPGFLLIAAYRGSYPAWYVLAMIKVFVQEGKMNQGFDSISEPLQKQLLAQAFALGHYVSAMMYLDDQIIGRRYYKDTNEMRKRRFALKRSAMLGFEPAQHLYKVHNEILTECRNIFR